MTPEVDMGIVGDIAGIGGSILSAGADWYSAISQRRNAEEAAKIARQNYEMEKGVFQYQKDLQNTMFSREDNAVQRRVADLKAAGINPILAAGQSASAGPVVSTKAPQQSLQSFEMKANALGQLASVGKTLAETASIYNQIQKTREETKGVSLQNRKVQETLNSEIARINLGFKVTEAELEKLRNEVNISAEKAMQEMMDTDWKSGLKNYIMDNFPGEKAGEYLSEMSPYVQEYLYLMAKKESQEVLTQFQSSSSIMKLIVPLLNLLK